MQLESVPHFEEEEGEEKIPIIWQRSIHKIEKKKEQKKKKKK